MSDLLKVLNERTSAEHSDAAKEIAVQIAILFKQHLKAPKTRTGHLEADGFPVFAASELDFYLFNREARMNEVWGSSEGGC